MANLFKKLFKSYIFDALLLIALGVVILVWPEQSLKALCICIGTILVLMGIAKILAYIADKTAQKSPLNVLFGLFQIALGAAFIIKSSYFINAFQIITGVILLYGSILMLLQAIRMRKTGGPLFVLSAVFGILTLALAVVIILNPAAFASFLTQLHGVCLMTVSGGTVVYREKEIG